MSILAKSILRNFCEDRLCGRKCLWGKDKESLSARHAVVLDADFGEFGVRDRHPLPVRVVPGRVGLERCRDAGFPSNPDSSGSPPQSALLSDPIQSGDCGCFHRATGRGQGPIVFSRSLFMADGFLGYRASLMLDVVVCALVVLVPLLIFSLYQVKVRKAYTLHRNLQLLLGAVLFVAVGLFEVDMRLQGGIDAILSKRDVPLSLAQRDWFNTMLYTHLVFAASTPVLWIATIAHGFWYFDTPPVPGPASRRHKLLGWASAADITLTSITGLAVYYFGFVV
jgi:hypothetical protein